MCTIDYYLQKFKQAVDENQIEEAIGYIKLALAIEPLRARLWLRQGYLQDELGEFENAIVSFRRAIELGDNLASLHSGIGRCARELGNFDEAEQALLKSIDLEPTAFRYVLLGDVQRCLDKDTDAEKSFREALKMDSEYDEAMVNLAIQLRDRKQTEEAIPLLREALKIDPNYAEAYEELGVCLRMQCEEEEAERMLRKSIELDDTRIWAHLYLGELLEAQDDLSGAEEEYHRAADLSPTLAIPHRLLGNFCKSQNRLAEAEHHYQRAKELED